MLWGPTTLGEERLALTARTRALSPREHHVRVRHCHLSDAVARLSGLRPHTRAELQCPGQHWLPEPRFRGQRGCRQGYLRWLCFLPFLLGNSVCISIVWRRRVVGHIPEDSRTRVLQHLRRLLLHPCRLLVLCQRRWDLCGGCTMYAHPAPPVNDSRVALLLAALLMEHHPLPLRLQMLFPRRCASRPVTRRLDAPASSSPSMGRRATVWPPPCWRMPRTHGSYPLLPPNHACRLAQRQPRRLLLPPPSKLALAHSLQSTASSSSRGSLPRPRPRPRPRHWRWGSLNRSAQATAQSSPTSCSSAVTRRRLTPLIPPPS